MDVRHAIHHSQAEALGTEDLRRHFLVTDLFRPGEVRATLTHYERMMVIGIAPGEGPLALSPDLGAPVGTAHLLERREFGAVNIGGPVRVVADGVTHELAFQEAIYLGMGTKEVTFENLDPAAPSRLFAASCPAHVRHPSRKISIADASPAPMGSPATANERVIYKYVHPGLMPTCQLVLGLTRLSTGSVWNTMPCHTHDRRMEAYFYFELPPEGMVVHLMGRPEATRHVIVRNEEAVVSPPWSIHSGAGTSAYAFIWAMAGENQVFSDMDHVAMGDLR
ncbi:MAG: 5-dehydro-4-deoxy-D-glucuronate isomerase [Siculibacillus sp.]|nr:5-dehydro-4-deoxy-D-glucuronate isomerase [Siculibacillus sp.]